MKAVVRHTRYLISGDVNVRKETSFSGSSFHHPCCMECSLWGVCSILRTSCQIRDGQVKIEKIPVKVLDAVVIHIISRVKHEVEDELHRTLHETHSQIGAEVGKAKKQQRIICLDVTNIANTGLLANAYPQLTYYRQQGDESGGVK